MIYLGSFYLWSNISIYVLSYFYYYDPSMSYNFIYLVDTVLGLSKWIGFQLGVYLFQIRRWNSKMIILLGGSISLTGVYLSSYTQDLASYLFLYCVLEGIGGASCYFVALICGWEWYP